MSSTIIGGYFAERVLFLPLREVLGHKPHPFCRARHSRPIFFRSSSALSKSARLGLARENCLGSRRDKPSKHIFLPLRGFFATVEALAAEQGPTAILIRTEIGMPGESLLFRSVPVEIKDRFMRSLAASGLRS